MLICYVWIIVARLKLFKMYITKIIECATNQNKRKTTKRLKTEAREGSRGKILKQILAIFNEKFALLTSFCRVFLYNFENLLILGSFCPNCSFLATSKIAIFIWEHSLKRSMKAVRNSNCSKNQTCIKFANWENCRFTPSQSYKYALMMAHSLRHLVKILLKLYIT